MGWGQIHWSETIKIGSSSQIPGRCFILRYKAEQKATKAAKSSC